MAVISRFGFDVKKEKWIRRYAFYFVFQRKIVKKWKISPLTAIFLKWKDQKCLFQFWFFSFTLCFKWNQSRRTKIDFNFQFSLMDENRMDERYTHRVPPPAGCFLSVFQFLIFLEDENWHEDFNPGVFKQERRV